MRRFLPLLLSVLLVFALVAPASAASPVQAKVLFDGVELQFDANPFVEDGRTLVPVRHLSEALGFKVEWEEADQKVTLTKDETVIVLWIGSNKVLVNGVEGKIDVPAKKLNNRTFVPIRFVAEALNAYVGWDPAQSAAVVYSGKGMLERVTKVQESQPNQKSFMGMGMGVLMMAQGFPFPIEVLSLEAGMESHTYQGVTLFHFNPVLTAMGQSPTDMGIIGGAVIDGKSYVQDPETGVWAAAEAEQEASADPFAMAGLGGFDPTKLNADMMAAAVVSVGKPIDVDGRKMIELHVDMSQVDMTALTEAMFAQMGAALGEQAIPQGKMTTDRLVATYLIDPATFFVHGLYMEFILSMEMMDEGQAMTMSMEMVMEMMAEPTDEPVELPADLQALLKDKP